MKHLINFIFALCLSSFAFSQLGNYDQNGEVKIIGQKTSLVITTKAEDLASNKEAAGAIIGAILSPIVDIGIAVAKEKAKQNVAKYLSSFTVSASGSQFWADEKKVNLPILTIKRNVMIKDNSSETNALTITLEPEMSPDKTAFRYLVKDPFIYTYSSAKTKNDYDYIDISLDIKFKGVLVTKGQYEIKDIRATNITIPMVTPGSAKAPTDKLYYSGWIPFLAMPSLEIEGEVTDQDTKTVHTKGTKEGKQVDETLATETTNLKMKSKDIKVLKTNSGLYEFEVTITETNPYKIKAENKQKLIEASGDASSKLLKAVIDAATKKDDKKDSEGGGQ